MTPFRLGDTLRNPHTGFEGRADGRHSFMSGTVQFSLVPGKLDDKGKPAESSVFDWQDLELVKSGPGEVQSTMPTFAFGDQIDDSVTEFSGVVVSRHEFINGCVNFGIQPQALNRDGDMGKPRMLNCMAMILRGRISDPVPVPPFGGPETMPARNESILS